MLETALPLAGVIVGILLVLGPFLATAIRSLLFWDAGGGHLSLQNFDAPFQDARFYQAVGNTLLAGAGATVLSCLLGFTLAWIVSRTDLPGRRWFEILNLVPFFLSPYVGAVAGSISPRPTAGCCRHWLGALGISLDFIRIYSIGGVIWVLALFYTPYVYLFVIAPMRQMDAALEDAARVHGASFWYTLRHVTIPLLMPSLLSGALVVFVTSAGLFDVPLALAATRGIRTMPTEIFQSVQYPSDFGRAAAFGVVVMTATIVLAILQRRYLGRRRFETVSGKGYRPRLIRLRWRGRVAALALELVYIGGGVVLPTLAMMMVAFSAIWTGRLNPAALTLRNFDYVHFRLQADAAGNPQQPVSGARRRDDGCDAGAAAGLLPQSRRRQTVALWSTRCSRCRSAFPALFWGSAFSIIAIRTPLYSTLTIILVAYIARFLSVRHAHGVRDAAGDQS